MKKVRYGSLLLGALLLLLSIVGCGEAVPPADGVVSQTETYTIERIGGLCYLTFAEGCEPRKWKQGGCVYETGDICFSSLEEMFQTFTDGALDFHGLQMIRTFNACDDNGRYSVIDPYFFKIPDLPEGYTISRIYVNGLDSCFSIKESDSNKSVGSFYTISEENYQKTISDFENFAEDHSDAYPNDTVTASDDQKASVYDVQSKYSKRRYKFYTLSDGEKTVYVREVYLLWQSGNGSRLSETVPETVTVVGGVNDSFFRFLVSHPEERPSEEWLLSFGVTLYNPPENATSEK